MNRIIFTLIIFAAMIPLDGAKQNTGTIDWSAYKISASYVQPAEVDESGCPVDTFTGLPVTLNRARMDASSDARDRAREMITSSIMKLRVDPDTGISGLAEKEETARRRISRIVSSRTRYKESPAGHLGSRCDAEIKINEIIDALPLEYPDDEIPRPDNNPVATEYTSLIIDARGLDVEPMIFPSVYNESGLEIYGKNFVKIKTVSRRGAASYTADDSSALKHRKAGTKPFYTAAVSALNGCPVISTGAHKKITSADGTIGSIKSGMVIIIIDRKKIKQ